MKVVPVVDAKTHLSAYLDRCHTESIVITKNGRARALLIPAPEQKDDLERLTLAYSPKLWRLMEEAALRVRQTGGIPHEEFWTIVEQRTAKNKRRRKQTK